MGDLISRAVRAAIEDWKNDFKGYVNSLNIPRDDYNGIMEYIDELPPTQPDHIDEVTEMVGDAVSRQGVLRLLNAVPSEEFATKAMLISGVNALPSAQLAQDLTNGCTDTISRAAVGDALNGIEISRNASWYEFYQKALTAVGTLPSAQPPKEIQKRVLWSGWKGYRDTRYKCPNCEKPVRNDDAYCHRCGQRLMFPKISFTDYVPGQKQDVIVRWDDEG